MTCFFLNILSYCDALAYFKWASSLLNFQRVGKCRVHGNGFNMFFFVHFQLQNVEEDGKSLVLVTYSHRAISGEALKPGHSQIPSPDGK